MINILKKIIRPFYKVFIEFISFKWFIYFITFFWPINNKKIVIDVDNGTGYRDNPKYIAEELLKDNNYKIYWFVKNNKAKDSLPDNIIPLKEGSLIGLFHLLTSAVWIDNSRKIVKRKKSKTLYLQTWHGCSAFKKAEKASENVLPESYIKIAKNDSRMIDIFVSDSKIKTDIIFNDYWYDGLVIETNAPRCAYLQKISANKNESANVRKKVYDYFGIDYNKKIVLYAPTFRADGSLEPYKIDYHKVINECSNRFGGDYVFLVRLHGNVSNKTTHFVYDKTCIFNATDYLDTQDLLVATDILITDYSSITFDFSLLKRPIFRYAVDIPDYVGDRGFYFDIKEYPYPLATSNDELAKVIQSFNDKEYITNLASYNQKTGAFLNDDSASVLKDIIVDYLKDQNINNLKNKYRLISYRKE